MVHLYLGLVTVLNFHSYSWFMYWKSWDPTGSVEDDIAPVMWLELYRERLGGLMVQRTLEIRKYEF